MVVWTFFVKQKTAYEMRISDWSSDVCSSDLAQHAMRLFDDRIAEPGEAHDAAGAFDERLAEQRLELADARRQRRLRDVARIGGAAEMAVLVQRDEILHLFERGEVVRSEEHTSELQSLMRISYAVFCFKKTKKQIKKPQTTHY